ncbi:hypothetical protein SEA_BOBBYDAZZLER_28 [Rhodococcus phage BobbyDazzler]|nr:hypothetical protein SEA_HARLEQUIN_28 [Rhodococcus phage Harlequin]AQP30955.1 hypothetical protein SEA_BOBBYDAZZLER_28 [Rhodococcus phage BobbyDazzler]ASR80807.1 hypothetical protein SEA_YONCESS_28 [Rhodococcus phage Yoncess]AWY04629.1 hypothetical protein PBI_BRYCE_28 [Rhodococcus phage Bryce]
MSKLMALGERAFEVWVGNGSTGSLAQKVMVGTGSGAVLAWQRLKTIALTKGRVTVPQTAWTTLLVSTVTGTGTGSFQGVYSWGTDVLQFLSFTRSVRLLVNGTQVAYQTGSFSNNGWSVTLDTGPYRFYDGDVIEVQAYTTGTNRTSARNVDSSALNLNLV